jgi:hypothetical protein
MKPVKATVKAILHLLLSGQLCGFCDENSNDDSALAASFADWEVTLGRRGGKVGPGLVFAGTPLSKLVELLSLSRSFMRILLDSS